MGVLLFKGGVGVGMLKWQTSGAYGRLSDIQNQQKYQILLLLLDIREGDVL